ncbi:MAG TPA: hypothetical protein VG929_06710 [Actinomycetota bacterium]|nr:hypothetical protein [Actinomycetota bacterium]
MTLLIGTSVLLIAASTIALVFGWITANGSLIWTSIAASAAAAVALALAFFRSRQEAAALARGAQGSRAATAEGEGDPASAGGRPAGDEVVAVRGSRRYHRPECRYASDKTAATMSRSAAHKEGFRPCAICKP